MPARFHTDTALHADSEFILPAGAARHVQVLRLQPGAPIVLFDGCGGEWSASVVRIGRSEVLVRVGAFDAVERDLALSVTLALGMPANERMDTLVEKATELGVAAIQPLLCERSVLRLSGERAAKKVAHWQAVAVAACEQSGRTRVPRVAQVRTVLDWLAAMPVSGPASSGARILLSLRDAQSAQVVLGAHAELGSPGAELTSLSGPEGGLTDTEEHAARRHGFVPIGLGPRTLRADTAPLALLAHLALSVPDRKP